MSNRRLLLIALLGAFVVGTVMIGGCKKRSGAAVSPVQNPPAGAVSPDDDDADDTADPAAAAARPARAAARPAARTGDGDDWRTEGDKKKKVARVARRRVVAAGTGAAAKKKEPDETPEEKAKRLAKESTLRSVDSALRGASASMKRCYDQAKAKAGSATLSFRVHRSGYVMSPSVSGVGPKVKSCIEGILKRLRVSGVKTSSLNVTRTLRFKRY